MPSQKIEKFCLFIIRWGSYLILFLPLLVYRGTLYPFIFGKIIGFRILVEIIFCAWLIIAIYKKEYRPNWRQPLLLTLTIFIATLVLTMFTGIDLQRSFWSTQERMTGVLTFLHLWLWFLVITSTFKEWQEWQKLIWLSLIACFLVGLYGLGQRLGLKFLLKEIDIRMSSTLGNPIYLGVYSMLHIFLASFLFLQERKKIWRFTALFLIFFNLFIMLFTATRGATMAFIFTFLLFLIFTIFTLPAKKAKKIIIPIFILIIILFTLGFAFWQTEKAQSLRSKMPYYLNRFLYIKNLTAYSEQRIIPWQIGLEGFQKKPILGWGWENYNVIFNQYFKPQIYRWGPEGSWFDRSHNQIIDLLALTGILGTLAYLVMYGSIFWLLLKKHRSTQIETPMETDKKNSWLNSCQFVILALMLLAYFIQNLTVFDTPAPLIVFYFSLGLTYFITQSNANTRMRANDANKPKTRAPNYPITQVPLPLLIFLVVIFLLTAIYKFNLEPLQQSKATIKGFSYGQVNLKAGLEWYKKALAKPVFTNPETRLQLAKIVFDNQGKPDSNQYQEILKFTISELEKNTQEHPLDMRYKLYLGQLYNLSYHYGLNFLNKAEDTLKRALELAPNRQQIYYELARTKVFKKEYQEAIQLSKKAVELDEQIGESHFNLGLTYLAANEIKLGLSEIEKASELGYLIYQNPELSVYLAQNYAQIGQYDKAIKSIDAAISAQPENLEYLAKKIIICHQAKYTEMVQNLLEKLREKNYNYALELEEYLKTLE
jgi:O-antigen ligase/tetratricopeptide (TPR) repeat protein